MTQIHQPGPAVFRSILPEDIDWKPFSAFPSSVRLAVLVGDPSKPGPDVIRVKAPGGAKLMPHRHPEDRIYTVVSGAFYIGLGETFDGEKVRAYPPGSVIVLPAMRHISTGLSPANISLKSRRPGRSALNISIPPMIRARRGRQSGTETNKSHQT